MKYFVEMFLTFLVKKIVALDQFAINSSNRIVTKMFEFFLPEASLG